MKFKIFWQPSVVAQVPLVSVVCFSLQRSTGLPGGVFVKVMPSNSTCGLPLLFPTSQEVKLVSVRINSKLHRIMHSLFCPLFAWCTLAI